MKMRRAFILPFTVVLLGFCALLIAAAHLMLTENTRLVTDFMRQSEERLKAQETMDAFLEKVMVDFDRAVCEDVDGNDIVRYRSDPMTMHGKYFNSLDEGMVATLSSTIAAFNAANAEDGCSITNLSLAGGDSPCDDLVDQLGVNHYVEARFRAICGNEAVEQKVRFGALGFGSPDGGFTNDVYALPTRCVESAINADCPLFFGHCAGVSGWIINGEVRTRGAVIFDRYAPEAAKQAPTCIHGDLHVALAPETGALELSPYGNGVVLDEQSNFGYIKAREGSVSELYRKSVNGANSFMRPLSPGRNLEKDMPPVASLGYFEYLGADSANGRFRGGYEWWRNENPMLQVTNAPGGTIFTAEAAEWFRIPVLADIKEHIKSFGGRLPPLSLGGDGATVLGCYPDGRAVKFTISSGGNVTVNTSTRESLVLIGSWKRPIVIDGPVYWNGDVILGGFISGQGSIYAGRNIHIVRDLIYKNPPKWDPYSDYDDTARLLNARSDMVALIARGNIVIGNFLDEITANSVDGVRGFREKVQLAAAPIASSKYAGLYGAKAKQRLDGYRWRKPVEVTAGSPVAVGRFDGNYFKEYDGAQPLWPRRLTDKGNNNSGNSVTNLCRPVVRIDSMLISANAICGVVGPGDFAWHKALLEPNNGGDDGLAIYPNRNAASIRAGHGMQLLGTSIQQRQFDYLLPPYTSFVLNGGLVCRDLALYVDCEEWVPGDADYLGEIWTAERRQAVINQDCRFVLDGDEAEYVTRARLRSELRTSRANNAYRSKRSPQNFLGLPVDASFKPQIMSSRFLVH